MKMFKLFCCYMTNGHPQEFGELTRAAPSSYGGVRITYHLCLVQMTAAMAD